jgi:hypothetical protein
METLDPVEHDVVEHDVIEGRVADLATAAAPVAIGEAAIYGRVALTSFKGRRQVDAERSMEASGAASFELGSHRVVYTSAPPELHLAPAPYHKGLQATFKLLQNKQREVIWQLRSDVSP